MKNEDAKEYAKQVEDALFKLNTLLNEGQEQGFEFRIKAAEKVGFRTIDVRVLIDINSIEVTK